MTEIMKFNDFVIMTISGIGYINGGMILGEISHIHLLSSTNKLLAYVGLAPSVYQFENFQATKLGCPNMDLKSSNMHLLVQLTMLKKNNATFKPSYNAKMAEGRTHCNALGHCAGKLVRIIWKMITDNVDFNIN